MKAAFRLYFRSLLYVCVSSLCMHIYTHSKNSNNRVYIIHTIVHNRHIYNRNIYIYVVYIDIIYQFSSVAQSCLTLCNPMDCSTLGFPFHHQLSEFTQTHVHWVSDAIQPSHPLSSPSPPALNISKASGSFPMSQLFASGGQSIGVSVSTSVLSMNTQDRSPLGWTGWISCSPRDSQESSPTPQFKSINSLALSFLYSPTLTFIHNYWKNHSLN